MAAEGGAEEADAGVSLPDYGPAPDFVGTQEWFNTDGKPLSIKQLTEGQGRVVLIDFWTYTCINCIRTLPEVESWDSEYRKDGLTIVGVHSPEFAFEKDAGNVADAIEQYGIQYPVVQDNDLGTWTAFGNQYWPAKYLIDADGDVRYVHFGEGQYEQTEAAIRSLLAEAGSSDLGASARPGRVERADPMLRTPETYLGTARAQGWVNGPQPGSKDYGDPDPGSLRPEPVRLRRGLGRRRRVGAGRRRGEHRAALPGAPGVPRPRRRGRATGAAGAARRQADRGRGRRQDVRDARATIGAQRLYRLVELPEAGRHTLELRFQPGIEGYAFTFG